MKVDMLTNKLKTYLTPQERVIDKNWLLNKGKAKQLQQSNFWDDLFMKEVGPIWQRLFLLKYQTKPFSLIKSFIPIALLDKQKNTSIDDNNVNLELAIDLANKANYIKKNILLTWPTSEESKALLLKQKTQVFVEKNYILHDKQVVRYEEEIVLPDRVEYED